MEPNAGIIVGFLLVVMGIIGIIGFIVYRYIRKYHLYDAAPVLELANLDYENQSHLNNSEELFCQ
ncbi:hypothetical protein [Wolbachia pipientis]|uniref:hypothetical protein n=1 Tax=Wolbachia pipientis TaxID=955 RepID=UPI0025A38201|nr:hypothetical protein [Wolbachia pipientis]MDM8335494.1 hypothetical protein [Wolbachia pipientis]